MAERMTHRPAAVVEPGARIMALARFEPPKVRDRALESNGRRVARADGGVGAGRTVELEEFDFAFGIGGHSHHGPVCPERQQGAAAIDQHVDRAPPAVGVDFDQRLAHPSSLATCWNQPVISGGKKIPAPSTNARWPNIGKYEALVGAPPGLGSPNAKL